MSDIKFKQSTPFPSSLLKSKSGPISVSTIDRPKGRENIFTPSKSMANVNSSLISPSSSGYKLSKLASRKKLLEPNQNNIDEKDKNDIDAAFISISTNRDDSPLHTSTVTKLIKSPISTPMSYTNNEELEAIQVELNELRAERDLLLQEKQIWLTNIINDNEKLEKMYQVNNNIIINN
jgi:hypothetical protein